MLHLADEYVQWLLWSFSSIGVQAVMHGVEHVMPNKSPPSFLSDPHSTQRNDVAAQDGRSRGHSEELEGIGENHAFNQKSEAVGIVFLIVFFFLSSFFDRTRPKKSS